MARRAKSASNKLGPRERLLVTATNLFTKDGIRAVGIDRILKESGVAKASLYNTFGSKDGLIAAYLKGIDDTYRARWYRGVADMEDPREKILFFFDLAERAVSEPSFRGSHFLNAATEFPHAADAGEALIRDAVAAHRNWLHSCIVVQLHESGMRDSDNVSELARRVRILYDGAVAGSSLEDGAAAVVAAVWLARRMTEQLLELY